MAWPKTKALFKSYFLSQRLDDEKYLYSDFVTLKLSSDIDSLMLSRIVFHEVFPAAKNKRTPNFVFLDGMTSW